MAKPTLTKLQSIILILLIIALGVGVYVFFKPHHSVTVAGAKLSTEATGPQALTDDALRQYLLQHYKGEVTGTSQATLIARVGQAIVSHNLTSENTRPFHFHLLSEPNLIDSFSGPSGDVYITVAFVNRMRTEGELAAALSGSIAHVLAGDRMTQASPTQLQFTVAQETAADASAVKLMSAAGYDPQALLNLFQVLTAAYKAKADVPFFATHPSAQWRLADIDSAIKALYPNGVPKVLSK